MNNTILKQSHIDSIMGLLAVVQSFEGSTAEVGVYRGGVSYLISRNSLATHYAFDTFSGLPEPGPFDVHKPGTFSAAEAEVRKYLEAPNVVVVTGLFPQTAEVIPPQEVFKLVHVDVDLYDGCKSALEFFWPRMVSGGVIIVDDYGDHMCPGVKKAVDEFGVKFTRSCGQAILIK